MESKGELDLRRHRILCRRKSDASEVMEVLTGIFLGIMGSLHCAGMCGPVALSVCSGKGIKYIITYNSGRIITYSLLGLLFGLAGSRIEFLGLQKFISISTGIIIVVTLFIPAFRGINTIKYVPVVQLMVKYMKAYLENQKLRYALTTGMLNGILPCGFVYIALAGSLSSGEAVNGAIFMISFGLGTLPAMIGISGIWKILNHRFRALFRKLIPVFTLAIALIFILRGLGIDIHNSHPSQNSKNSEVICR